MQCFFRCLLRNHFLPDLSRFFVQVKSIYKHRKKTKIVSYIKLRVKFFSANPLIWVLCIATAKFLWHFFLWRQRYHFIPDLSMKCPIDTRAWRCLKSLSFPKTFSINFQRWNDICILCIFTLLLIYMKR